MAERDERSKQLQNLVAALESLIENPVADNFILPGDGYDESMLIGSPDSYLRLAKVLVEIVRHAGDGPPWPRFDWGADVIEGVPVVITNQIKEVFHDFSPVWVMCAYITRDDVAAGELASKLAGTLMPPRASWEPGTGGAPT